MTKTELSTSFAPPSILNWAEAVGDVDEEVELVVVGGGLSGVFTLISLFENFPDPPASVALIEPTASLGGLAYSEKAGATALTITPLSDFLPAAELTEFIDWIEENRTWLLNDFVSEVPEAFREIFRVWVDRNRSAIDDGEWGSLHVPRRWFGLYLEERLNKAAAAVDTEFCVIPDSVADVRKADGDRFEVTCESGRRFRADRIVLALGAGRNRHLGLETQSPRYVDDLYDAGIIDSLHEIVDQSSESRILVVGANASAMEVIYHLGNRPDVLASLTVLSPSGELPFLYPEPTSNHSWVPSGLDALVAQPTPPDSRQIREHVEFDLRTAHEAGLTGAQSFDSIKDRIAVLLTRLPATELAQFACETGPAISRLQRRAGSECWRAARLLQGRGRLKIEKGRLSRLEELPGGGFIAECELDGQTERHRFDFVLNCTGAQSIDSLPPDSLIPRLIDSGLIGRNNSSAGIAANDSLECSPGVFVIGPRIAGNVIAGRPVWHVEHCGRIIGFAQQLATELANAS